MSTLDLCVSWEDDNDKRRLCGSLLASPAANIFWFFWLVEALMVLKSARCSLLFPCSWSFPSLALAHRLLLLLLILLFALSFSLAPVLGLALALALACALALALALALSPALWSCSLPLSLHLLVVFCSCCWTLTTSVS